MPGRVTQEKMALLLALPGIDRDKLANIESGRRKNVPEEVVAGYARVTNTAVKWFYDPADTPPVPADYLTPPRPTNIVGEQTQPSQVVETARRVLRPLPVLATITAGEPWMQNADGVYEEIPDWGAEFERWGRVIEGESMMPVLRPGDIAIFENRRAEPNHVVHAFDHGVDTVKCWRGTQQAPTLAPFNEEYEPLDAREWNIKGVCVGIIRKGPFGSRAHVEIHGGLSWGMRHTEFLA